MELLQYVYITVLNIIYKGTRYISPAIRQGIAFFSFFAMIMFLFMCYSPGIFGFDLNYTQRGIVSTIFLSINIIMSIDRPLKAIKWNHFFSALWVAFGIIIFISCLVLDMGEGFMTFATSVLFLFPCFYLVWNNRGDYEKCFLIAAKIIAIVFFLFFILCVIFAPFNEHTVISGRYMGATTNANYLGMIAASAMTCGLYLFTCRKGSAWIMGVFTCEIAISLTIFSGSRTSLISIVAQSLVFLIFYFRYDLRTSKDKLKTVVKFLLLIVLVIGCRPVNEMLLNNTFVPVKEPVATVVKGTVKMVKSEARELRAEKRGKKLRNSETAQAALQGQLSGSEESVQPQQSEIAQRFSMEGKDLNQLSSGRLNIWKLYLEEISWKGHDKNNVIQGYPVAAGEPWAHNVFLEVAYRFGLAAGILYLMIAVYGGVCLLRFLFSKDFYRKYQRGGLFSVLAISSFCILSMLDKAIFPLQQDFILLYFIGLTPFFKLQNGRTQRGAVGK